MNPKHSISVLLLCIFLITGCAEQQSVTMMPAPVAYHNKEVDPFSHLSLAQKTTSISIFYATNRNPEISSTTFSYGNEMSTTLHLGKLQVQFGDNQTSWDDLYHASTNADIPEPIQISISSGNELSVIDTDTLNPDNFPIPPEIKPFTDAINRELEAAIDKEIVIYIHGAKGSFLKSATLTAEIDHFSGRDFIAIAFTWPSRQNILNYLVGNDVERAQHSSSTLHALIEILAKHTITESINIISYSAGGKLLSKAIYELRHSHPLLSAEELKTTFKLGTLLFTAADVSVDTFLERLPDISDMAQQVVVTVSDADNVLRYSKLFMRGGDRIGTRKAEFGESAFVLDAGIRNFEIVDFSFGSEERGFNITGHHYWHRHPWASSDVIFLLRSDNSSKFRGLTPSGIEGTWYLPAEYPSQVRSAIKQHFGNEW